MNAPAPKINPTVGEIEALVKALREYARTEHGKRARLHFEIMQTVFAHPEAFANLIEDGFMK